MIGTIYDMMENLDYETTEKIMIAGLQVHASKNGCNNGDTCGVPFDLCSKTDNSCEYMIEWWYGMSELKQTYVTHLLPLKNRHCNGTKCCDCDVKNIFRCHGNNMGVE